jgi:hypothetical protein
MDETSGISLVAWLTPSSRAESSTDAAFNPVIYTAMDQDTDPLWVRIITVMTLYFAAMAVVALGLAILRAFLDY